MSVTENMNKLIYRVKSLNQDANTYNKDTSLQNYNKKPHHTYL